MLAPSPRSSAVLASNPFSLETTMTAATIAPTRLRPIRLRFGLAALAVGAFSAFGSPAHARGPEGIADVAEIGRAHV